MAYEKRWPGQGVKENFLKSYFSGQIDRSSRLSYSSFLRDCVVIRKNVIPELPLNNIRDEKVSDTSNVSCRKCDRNVPHP